MEKKAGGKNKEEKTQGEIYLTLGTPVKTSPTTNDKLLVMHTAVQLWWMHQPDHPAKVRYTDLTLAAVLLR